jgi:hypothetical protein
MKNSEQKNNVDDDITRTVENIKHLLGTDREIALGLRQVRKDISLEQADTLVPNTFNPILLNVLRTSNSSDHSRDIESK